MRPPIQFWGHNTRKNLYSLLSVVYCIHNTHIMNEKKETRNILKTLKNLSNVNPDCAYLSVTQKMFFSLHMFQIFAFKPELMRDEEQISKFIK